jgi:Tripartite ATP-independent periplasmic transporters, DctQ component
MRQEAPRLAARFGPSADGPARILARRFDLLEEFISGLALVAVILAVGWGVLSRYVSRQPAPWANEVATLAFAWLIFIGAAACFKYGMHPASTWWSSACRRGSPAARGWSPMR